VCQFGVRVACRVCQFERRSALYRLLCGGKGDRGARSYGVEHGREAEVFHELQAAIDDVNRAREAAWEDVEHRRSTTEAAAVVSEAQLQAVRESFETARRSASSR
jgi:hypothetical protein